MNSIVEGRRCLGCGYELAGRESDRCPECGRLNEALVLLAKYREKQVGRRREFYLYADRVVIETRHMFGQQDVRSLSLAPLSADFGILRGRSKYFSSGIGLMGFAVIPAVFQLSANLDHGPITTTALVISLTLVLAGLVLMIRTAKRIELYLFRDLRRPEVILLDVARQGPDQARFEDFIGLLIRQIHASHAKQ